MHYDRQVKYEYGTENEKLSITIHSCLLQTQSQFQDIAIYQTGAYGKVLMLDGLIQSTEKDEHRYHESLIHPAMIAHDEPRSVLIIGGGEGATAREILRYPSVQRVVMVDIDAFLIEQCEKFLPEWHQNAFDDPRLELIIGDGLQYVKNCREMFDIIIVDVCDGFEESDPTIEFFSKKFYKQLKSILEIRGIVVYQAMCASEFENEEFAEVYHGLKKAFTFASPYMTYIPSFWSQWGFVVASDVHNVGGMNPAFIDKQLELRNIEKHLKFFDGSSFMRMFALPKDTRLSLKKFAKEIKSSPKETQTPVSNIESVVPAKPEVVRSISKKQVSKLVSGTMVS
ncbi:MAG: polyamine aminopropyltransferase [Gammaproteobacteria bacterium]|nr:polyamine aminopropyltransferase [Gammaproteobacteria bacterium]MDH5729895.1 polyamine aminopropyltransferase [Gammaproteobacteria bacterium]